MQNAKQDKLLLGTNTKMYKTVRQTVEFLTELQQLTAELGREDMELLTHFKRLGTLRKENKALRLGDIQFFRADHQMIGFHRTWEDQTVSVYMNRGADHWEIPGGKLLLGHNMQTVAPDAMILGPKGFCVMEE